MADIDSTRDVDTLRQMAKLLEFENGLLAKRIEELALENAALRGDEAPKQLEFEVETLTEQVDRFQRAMFGDSSEKRPRTTKEAGEAGERAKSGHGRTPQPDLDISTDYVELDKDKRICDTCNGTLAPVEGLTDDSEHVSMVQRCFKLNRVKRQKYRCKCETLLAADKVRTLVPGGRYAVEVACHIAVEKYLNHMPLDRQRRSMASQGLRVSTSTLWDQINQLARYHEPSYELLRKYVLCEDVVGVDETWWRLWDKKPNKRWWVWTLSCPSAVWHGIDESRSAKTAAKMIGDDFEGALMTDGYKAYELITKHNPDIISALCWAHARRKFVEAEPRYPQCNEAIGLIGQVYAIDRDTPNPARLFGDDKLAAIAARAEARSERAPPILEKLREWAIAQRALPKSSMRKAIDYMLGHWKGLTRFVEDPLIPLDNNDTERMLRGVVVGRKNHFGSRSKRGTEVAGILYSLIDTARLNGIDPFRYLCDATHEIIENPDAVPLPIA